MNVKNSTKNKRGFTIIEVVLVLAIAGLIFLMVFIALPALQRSQRDTQRRDDYGMLSAAVTSYAASNGGKLGNLHNADGTCKELDPSKYINNEGLDPDGKAYILKGCDISKFTDFEPDPQVVYIVTKADCSKNKGAGTAEYDYMVPTKNESTRAFAIFGYLESGSQTYCSASQ